MTLIPLKPVSVLVLELLDVGLHVGDLLLLRKVLLQQLLILLMVMAAMNI